MACTFENGLECLAWSTTNDGRSWFIDPKPYDSHEPIEALPFCIEPVYMSWLAGS
jgi:hypothetical protein